MINESNRNSESEDRLVYDITNQPIKSLENRIENIQNDLQARQKLSDKILSQLLTEKIQLEERLKRASYQANLTGQTKRETELSQRLANLQENISKEELSSFNDLSSLKEKLQEAKEELETEKLSRRLF